MTMSNTLKRLARLNLPPEAMQEVLDILAEYTEADERRLSKQRQRQRQYDVRKASRMTSEQRQENVKPDVRTTPPDPLKKEERKKERSEPSVPHGAGAPVYTDSVHEL